MCSDLFSFVNQNKVDFVTITCIISKNETKLSIYNALLVLSIQFCKYKALKYSEMYY